MVAISIDIVGQLGLTWPHWQGFVAQIEAMGFAGLFRSDHFTLPFPVDLDSLEPIVSLTYLADHTEHVHFGPLVAPLSFRDPVMLARQALALDDLSQGRMVLGLGAGHVEREHLMFGYQLGDMSTRFARFAEGLEIITRLLRSDTPVSYSGQFYTLHEAMLLPRPHRPNGPPILIGGSGPQPTMPLVARYADIWNGVNMTAAEFRERSALLDELLQVTGRQPQDVRRTMTFFAICGHDPAELERRLRWSRLLPMFTGMPLAELIEVLRRDWQAFVGTPDELVAHIQAYVVAGADRDHGAVGQYGRYRGTGGARPRGAAAFRQCGSANNSPHMKLSMIMAMRASPPPRRPNTRMQLDRFAREIIAFLKPSDAARSRRLMRNSLARTYTPQTLTND